MEKNSRKNIRIALACGLYCILFVMMCASLFVGVKYFLFMSIIVMINTLSTFIMTWSFFDKIRERPFVYLSGLFFIMMGMNMVQCVFLATL